jgi:hypothetical protein
MITETAKQYYYGRLGCTLTMGLSQNYFLIEIEQVAYVFL